MYISSFDDLLVAAKQQPEPQRLLFVFTRAELPPGSTAAQRERFLAGEGGALVPVMCVDKAPDELLTFADLVQESHQFGQGKEWHIVFAAAASGSGGRELSSEAVEKALQGMVEAIKADSLAAFAPFDKQGQAVKLA